MTPKFRFVGLDEDFIPDTLAAPAIPDTAIGRVRFTFHGEIA